MTPEAKKLIEICGYEGSVEAALKENPNLITGLNEYTEWVKAEAKAISQTNETQPVTHGLSKLAQQLPSSKPK